MTRDDIIRMAREAGFDESNAVCAIVVRHSNGSWVGIEERLAAFAGLVAQAEREACATICDIKWMAESYCGLTARACAEEIRARGDT